MQIVITCDSYDELIATAGQILKQAEGDKCAPAEEPKKTPAKKAAPVKAAEPEEQPLPFKPAEDTEPAAGKSVDESDVKVLLADKIKKGKKAEVRALFEEYGVTKLSELVAKCPDKLPELAQKAGAL